MADGYPTRGRSNPTVSTVLMAGLPADIENARRSRYRGWVRVVQTVGACLVLLASGCVAAVSENLPEYRSTAVRIDSATAQRMSSSWRSGCPVPLSRLRLLKLRFVGFDGQAHWGELVVNADVADDVRATFSRLYSARFRIERMRLVDAYGADDDASMAANNTSAFNCRRVGGSSSWSEHAYGRAIDINPVQNPYVRGTSVQPPSGSYFLDRRGSQLGLIQANSAATRAFDSIGWGWGGRWTRSKDYQHFSSTGR